jgi:hypothetical protein
MGVDETPKSNDPPKNQPTIKFAAQNVPLINGSANNEA